MSPNSYLWVAAGLVVLSTLTVALAGWAGADIGFTPTIALGRATVQLTVVALLLRGILAVPWTVIAFIALMLSTASLTSAGRLHEMWHGRRIALAGVVSGSMCVLVLVFGMRLVQLQVTYLVAVGGIVIGSTMTAATLAGRNFLHASRSRAAEVEGWLALGATPAVANRDIARHALRESLLPNLDQTRSTGLVTLPGAFVGALFGGASPADAARFQLVVLASIALASTITGTVVTRLAARTPYLSVDRAGLG